MAKKLTPWFLITYTILVLCSFVSGQQTLPLPYKFNSSDQILVSFTTQKFTGASTQIFVNYTSAVALPGVTVSELWRVDRKGDVLVDAIFVDNVKRSRRRSWKETRNQLNSNGSFFLKSLFVFFFGEHVI
ncbi:hypothetical protein GLOIN_2v1738316 [Rhizophagus irregularis DAOM 181602=DAOM 197198]|nr:hypothetical protein GLOIN_2v1738316 [Rhizophagus irregularis DAOM 181602=DAOM 197198]CAB4491541.1 unnamed protein product [Rhizophagus irregularis]CAB5194159.1 unnamed protein product [Rhizophagus irregularis]